ncbi:hypothetical protein D3C85_639370 [compost metagenome]
MAVGEQHHQTVDTNTLTGSRRQAVFQRGDEVGVVEHGFVVARFFLVHLILEALGLIFRIVQLGEAVGQLAATDEELEAIGHVRVLVVAAGQRGDGSRVLGDEGRLQQHVLNGLFEDGGDHVAQLPALHQLDVQTLGDGLGALQGGQIVLGHIRVELEDGLDHGEALERLTEVDGQTLFALFGVTDLGVTQDVLGQGAQQLLGQVHQIDVIGIGHVELDHGELGVVTHRDPFVTEVAVDLVDALETTDHQTLQIELGGDTQVHVDVQRIVVSDERTRGGTTRDDLHHGGFHFHEALLVEELADAGNHLGADHEGLAGLFVGDQIQVALTAAGFLVGQAFVLLGQRTQCLGQQADFAHMDGELAGVGAEQGPFHADYVPQIPLLELLVVEAFRQVVTGHVDLDLASHVLQGREGSLAHDPAGHDTTGNLHPFIQGHQLVGALVAKLGVQIAGQAVTTEVVGERVALGAQGGQLGATLSHLVVQFESLVDFRSSGLFRHGDSCCSVYRPDFRLASINLSKSPSSTDWVLRVSTPVRRSLIRESSST